jgi:hypothetical protein
MLDRLRARWESEFRPVTRADRLECDVPFDVIHSCVTVFLERLAVRRINSDSEDELDYVREPDLKVVVVGGNRLSRGLTLEGLLVSYFVRPTLYYDTLIQMERWFGFREEYADLTRIYTTGQLEAWFRDLAEVEAEVREDIERYEIEGLTPLELGVRIRCHPGMLVTSPLKMQNTRVVQISFAGQLVQTITFPFDDHQWLESNIAATREFLTSLGPPNLAYGQPAWRSVSAESVLGFLGAYRMDPAATRVRIDALTDYITRQLGEDELVQWLVAVMGRGSVDDELGTIDLGIAGHGQVNLIERTKLRGTNSLKAITSPGDQEIGLTPDQIQSAEHRREGGITYPAALRAERDPREGVLLIYPISQRSGRKLRDQAGQRGPIFDNALEGEDVIGLALILPNSNSAATRDYLVGRAWQGTESDASD